MAGTSKTNASNGAGQRETLREAEETLDRLSRQVGGLLANTLARAREEAEDIWAEAQALSRRG